MNIPNANNYSSPQNTPPRSSRSRAPVAARQTVNLSSETPKSGSSIGVVALVVIVLGALIAL